MNNQTVFTDLRDALVALYPEEHDTREIVDTAGINSQQIAFSNLGHTNWHNILTEALRQNRLDALLQVVQSTYSHNLKFQAAYHQYHHLVNQGDRIELSNLVMDSDPPSTIMTEGGTFIAGNVIADEGDVIGRDQKINRDKIEGDQINAHGAKGLINRPTAPVTQHYNTTFNLGHIQIPKPVAIVLLTGFVAALVLVGSVALYTRNTFQAVTAPAPIPTETPLPSATPLAFATAAPNETLILIATFTVTDGNRDTLPQREIRNKIREKIQELHEENLRVEVEPMELTSDQYDTARQLGEQYGASIVIWGDDTGARVTVNFLNMRDPLFEAANVTINETHRTQIVSPSDYAQFITEDLPQEMSFFALFAIGQSYSLNGQFSLAIERIEAAIAGLTPNAKPYGLDDAYFELGWLYQYANPISKNLDRAIDDYDRVVQLTPDYSDAYYNRGFAYLDQRQFDESVADFNKALQLFQGRDKADAYNGLGLAYYFDLKLDAAIFNYHKALQLYTYDWDRAVIYGNLCWGYDLQQKPQPALFYCQRAIEFDPQPSYYDGRGIAYGLKGDFPSAISDIQEYVNWLEKQTDPQSLVRLPERKAWLATLLAGKNPFTPEVLAALPQSGVTIIDENSGFGDTNH